jgi:hypothetical protein
VRKLFVEKPEALCPGERAIAGPAVSLPEDDAALDIIVVGWTIQERWGSNCSLSRHVMLLLESMQKRLAAEEAEATAAPGRLPKQREMYISSCSTAGAQAAGLAGIFRRKQVKLIVYHAMSSWLPGNKSVLILYHRLPALCKLVQKSQQWAQREQNLLSKNLQG